MYDINICVDDDVEKVYHKNYLILGRAIVLISKTQNRWLSSAIFCTENIDFEE